MIIFVIKIINLTKYFRALKPHSIEDIDKVIFCKNDKNHHPSLCDTLDELWLANAVNFVSTKSMFS